MSRDAVDGELICVGPLPDHFIVQALGVDRGLADAEEVVAGPPASLATVALEVVLVCLHQEPLVVGQGPHVDEAFGVACDHGALVAAQTREDEEDWRRESGVEKPIVRTLIAVAFLKDVTD